MTKDVSAIDTGGRRAAGGAAAAGSPAPRHRDPGRVQLLPADLLSPEKSDVRHRRRAVGRLEGDPVQERRADVRIGRHAAHGDVAGRELRGRIPLSAHTHAADRVITAREKVILEKLEGRTRRLRLSPGLRQQQGNGGEQQRRHLRSAVCATDVEPGHCVT